MCTLCSVGHKTPFFHLDPRKSNGPWTLLCARLTLPRFIVSFPIYMGAQYDASTTNLTYLIPAPANANTRENLEVILSFLSPITPTSTLRQAVPASYLAIYVHGGFDVNVYVDVNGQWVSGDRGSEITWSLGRRTFKNGKGLKTFRVRRRTEQVFTEIHDRAEWGTLHFTGPFVSYSKRLASHGSHEV